MSYFRAQIHINRFGSEILAFRSTGVNLKRQKNHLMSKTRETDEDRADCCCVTACVMSIHNCWTAVCSGTMVNCFKEDGLF